MMVDCALRYASHGWPVFPLAGKEPLARTQGVLDATTDEYAIRQAWGLANWNIGIALPRHLIVDVDSKHNGPAWLTEHRRKLHGITLTCRTGGGGWHFYFQLPSVHLRGIITKGVDLRRGPGQYVVAPPSVHPVTGAQYDWVKSWPRRPAMVPAWLLELVRYVEPERIERKPRANTDRDALYARARAYMERVDIAISGNGGHQATITAAVKLVDNFYELPDADLYSLFSEWNQRCDPPWSEKELKHKMHDALRIVRRKAG